MRLETFVTEPWTSMTPKPLVFFSATFTTRLFIYSHLYNQRYVDTWALNIPFQIHGYQYGVDPLVAAITTSTLQRRHSRRFRTVAMEFYAHSATRAQADGHWCPTGRQFFFLSRSQSSSFWLGIGWSRMSNSWQILICSRIFDCDQDCSEWYF